MFKFIWCLKWRWNNRNWRLTRQKKKAMRREFGRRFRMFASDSDVYMLWGL